MSNREVSSSVRAAIAITLCELLLFPPLRGQEETSPKLNLVIVEGDGAVNNIHQRVSREVIVKVEDENHRPVGGVVVTFLLPDRGAGGSFANGAKSLTIQTDMDGRAVAKGMRPNNVSGQFTIRVTASYQGQTAIATISQSNVAAAAGGAAAAGVSGKLIAIIAVAGAAAAGGIIAATRGGGSSSTPNPPNPPTSTSVTLGGTTVNKP